MYSSYDVTVNMNRCFYFIFYSHNINDLYKPYSAQNRFFEFNDLSIFSKSTKQCPHYPALKKVRANFSTGILYSCISPSPVLPLLDCERSEECIDFILT